MGIFDIFLHFFEGLPPIGVFCILLIGLLFFIVSWSNKATDNLCKLLRAFGDMLHRPRERSDHRQRPPISREPSRVNPLYEQGYQRENGSRHQPRQRGR